MNTTWSGSLMAFIESPMPTAISEAMKKLPYLAQSISVLSYLMIGLFYIEFVRFKIQFFYTFLLAIALEQILSLIYYRKLRSPASACITATSIYILLQNTHLEAYLVAVSIALASKYLIKLENKHVFNPANFGLLIATILMPSKAASIASQWVVGDWMVVYVFVMGLLTCIIAKRFRVAASYLLTFTSLYIVYGITTDTHPFFIIGTSLNVASLIFAFHMVTDPRTSPSGPRSQILFGVLIAVLDVTFRSEKYIYAPYLALVIASSLVPIVKADYFLWKFQKKN